MANDAWIVEVRGGIERTLEWLPNPDRDGPSGEWGPRFGVTMPRAKAVHFIRQDVARGHCPSGCQYRLRNFDTGEIVGPDRFRFVLGGGLGKKVE
jgi:hypothetical protein